MPDNTRKSLIPQTAFNLFLTFVFFKMRVGHLAPSLRMQGMFFCTCGSSTIKCEMQWQHSDDTVATNWSVGDLAGQNLGVMRHSIMMLYDRQLKLCI